MNILSYLSRLMDDHLLSRYDDQEFVLKQKARVLSAHTLATICLIFCLFGLYSYARPNAIVALPTALTLLVCLVILVLIKIRYFSIAGHLLVSSIIIAAWTTIFVDTQHLIMKLDSISYVLSAFTLLSLTVVEKKKTIFLYLALNCFVLYLLFLHITGEFGLDPKVAIDYSVDNLLCLIFISIVCYQVVSINKNALDKAHDSVQQTQSEIKKNQELNQSLELKVFQRTEELQKNNEELQREIRDRKVAETRLRKAQEQLIATAHKAGMAEIATDSLHNVGNVLNSVKTSSYVIKEAVKKSPLDSFSMTCDLIRSHSHDLPGFVLNNPKGIKVLEYCLNLEQKFKESFTDIEDNVERLNSKIDTIANVIIAQQNQAGTASMEESLDIIKSIEDSLSLLMDTHIDHDIEIIKSYQTVPPLVLQKTKLVHVLINLFKNAVQSMNGPFIEARRLTISVFSDTEAVNVVISDTGSGIPRDNLKKIFNHGFSTKIDGYGFGLHSCANYIDEMGATIEAESEGEGKGATFRLVFPLSVTD